MTNQSVEFTKDYLSVFLINKHTKKKPEELDLDALLTLADTFNRSTNDIFTALILPVITIALRNLTNTALTQKFDVVVSKLLSGEIKTSAEVNSVIAEENKKHQEKFSTFTKENLNYKEIEGDFEYLARDQNLRATILVMYKAALVQTWTSFETLAADIWESYLNAYPDSLVKNTLESSISKGDTDSNINSKHVQLGLLYRYNFDLRNCMGTILREKYDFASVSGMQRAYADAFGKDHAVEIKTIFSNPNLSLLESLRHNIVHRAGIADEKLMTRLKNQTNLQVAAGKDLPLSGKLTAQLLSSVIDCGGSLLEFADKWAKPPAQ